MLKKISKYAILTCNNHQELDKKTIKKFIPGNILMENAGKAIFKKIKNKFDKKKRIKILSGPGNNGGDGIVLARLLKEDGFKHVYLFCIVSKNKLKGDARIAADKFNEKFNSFNDFRVSNNDLIIDSIFGSGLKKNISGSIKRIIEKVNSRKPYCISVDIPSGINGDTGQVQGVALKCKETITFTRKKPGHLLFPGSEHSGNIKVEDIGINLERLSFKPIIFENHPDNWINKFPWPNQKSHKYTRGFSLIICGDKMTGASRLAARGAARIGCGLLCLGVPKKTFDIYSTENPIALIENIDDENELSKLLKDKKIDTILIGPGLGVSKKKLKLILNVIKYKKKIIVLDADALKNNFRKILLKNKTKIIITPHEGEFSNVLKKIKLKNNKIDKLFTTINFTKKTKLNLILKGSKTIICSREGRISINTNSSPFLATGGSGDVLAGMVTGLLAQGMDIFNACCASVWIHGEIARINSPPLGGPPSLLSFVAVS